MGLTSRQIINQVALCIHRLMWWDMDPDDTRSWFALAEEYNNQQGWTFETSVDAAPGNWIRHAGVQLDDADFRIAYAKAERMWAEDERRRERGRPPVFDEPRTRINLYLSEALLAKIDAVTANGARSAWIEQACREQLARDGA